jgi:thymidylate synthase
MNNLDKSYQALLQDILDIGVKKEDRTGTGTISVFGRQIRHKMSEGFPLITSKKMYFKGIVTELLWFLRGDTNIKYLVDNDCHIWDGDCYQAYLKNWKPENPLEELDDPYRLISGTNLVDERPLSKDMFIHCIKTDDEFANKWGDLGPVYGKQWRGWKYIKEGGYLLKNGNEGKGTTTKYTDQIANLIQNLKTNPDSRRLMVNAWNVGELDSMVLPPCHYGFQVYTRELSSEERKEFAVNKHPLTSPGLMSTDSLNSNNIPTRAISLIWNQRSVDTFLGLPFNIASYGLLLEIIAKAVNMVPDELIGNLGDVHLYSNHIEQAKEQIGRELTVEERTELYKKQQNLSDDVTFSGSDKDFHKVFDDYSISKRTREPYPLPTLNINTEFWPTESGECGIGAIDSVAVFNNFTDEHFCKCLLEEDIQLVNYQSHSIIKAPLSN